MRAIFAALFGLIGTVLAPDHASAAPKASELVQVDLVSEPRAVEPGRPFTVAVRLSMKEHWHTYWRNPGDSGLATEIAWTLPPGFSAGPIQWPIPARIPVSHLVNYGYEGETALLVEITPPADLKAGTPVEIKARVNYLVCERECIPGEASPATSLLAAGSPGGGGADPATRYVFDAARANQPKPSPWASRLERDGERWTLRVDAPGLSRDALRSAYFFPAHETALDHAAPQTLAVEPGGITLSLTRNAFGTGAPPAELAGVLVLEETLQGGSARQGFQIGSPLVGGASTASASAAPRAEGAPAVDLSPLTILGAALFAFLGGLVLNLMPCVFPVLSIKVLSLVRHSGEGPAAIRLGGLAYAAGVVASFLALAGILLALRAGGAEIGWGFQLQSPALVAALVFLLFAMGLSLSGAVEFGTSLAARAGGVASRSGPSGSFLTGVLAAVVATPCTAPFMGAAVGYALTAPPAVAIAVFGALGLGMASPFLLLTIRPSLVSRLPRPGAWMETLKQVLAFPVYATVAWLLFVLSQQVGPTGLFATLLGLVLLAFGVWSWGLAATRSGWGRGVGRGFAAASLAGLLAIGWTVGEDRAATTAIPVQAAAAGGPERFTQARLDALTAEDRPVFVNMTAAWCITCLVNERVVLATEVVRARFSETGITYLKGDWTNQNPEITRLLERHGRSGVPLYVVYPGRGEPLVLPQILTESVVLDGLARLSTPSRRADLRSPAALPPGATR